MDLSGLHITLSKELLWSAWWNMSVLLAVSLIHLARSARFDIFSDGMLHTFPIHHGSQRFLKTWSIIVRHIKSIREPSLPLRVYVPIRSTHNTLQGVVMTSFGGTCPYFWLFLLFTWQDLQDLTYFWMVCRIPFQYITDLNVSSRRECPGCWR